MDISASSSSAAVSSVTSSSSSSGSAVVPLVAAPRAAAPARRWHIGWPSMTSVVRGVGMVAYMVFTAHGLPMALWTNKKLLIKQSLSNMAQTYLTRAAPIGLAIIGGAFAGVWSLVDRIKPIIAAGLEPTLRQRTRRAVARSLELAGLLAMPGLLRAPTVVGLAVVIPIGIELLDKTWTYVKTHAPRRIAQSIDIGRVVTSHIGWAAAITALHLAKRVGLGSAMFSLNRQVVTTAFTRLASDCTTPAVIVPAVLIGSVASVAWHQFSRFKPERDGPLPEIAGRMPISHMEQYARRLQRTVLQSFEWTVLLLLVMNGPGIPLSDSLWDDLRLRGARVRLAVLASVAVEWYANFRDTRRAVREQVPYARAAEVVDSTIGKLGHPVWGANVPEDIFRQPVDGQWLHNVMTQYHRDPASLRLLYESQDHPLRPNEAAAIMKAVLGTLPPLIPNWRSAEDTLGSYATFSRLRDPGEKMQRVQAFAATIPNHTRPLAREVFRYLHEFRESADVAQDLAPVLFKARRYCGSKQRRQAVALTRILVAQASDAFPKNVRVRAEQWMEVPRFSPQWAEVLTSPLDLLLKGGGWVMGKAIKAKAGAPIAKKGN